MHLVATLSSLPSSGQPLTTALSSPVAPWPHIFFQFSSPPPSSIKCHKQNMLYFGTCPGASQAGTSPLLWIIGRIAWTQTNNFILKVKGLLPTVALAYRLLLSRPHAPDVSHLKPFQDSLELYYNVLCIFSAHEFSRLLTESLP